MITKWRNSPIFRRFCLIHGKEEKNKQNGLKVKNSPLKARLWNDNKIRNLGFETKYSLTDAVETAVKDLLSRYSI
jgi:hypothetical protein